MTIISIDYTETLTWMRNCCKSLAFLILVLVSPEVYSQAKIHGYPRVPLVTNFNTFDYQGGIQNWDITQSEKGFIYVANNFGLLEFDGENWINHEIPFSTKTLAICVDDQGRIFTGGQNQIGYFESNAQGTYEFTSLIGLLPPNRSIDNIWDIIQHEGAIYYNSGYSLLVYKDGKFSEHIFDNGIERIFRVSNRLYASVAREGVYELIGENFRHLSASNQIKDLTIRSIIPSVDGELLLFTFEGEIYKLGDQISRWETEFDSFLRSSSINTALLLENNTIAIATQNNGIFLSDIDGGYISQINIESGLNSNTAITLFEDNFKNLWVGLSNGLSIVELASPFSFINKSVGINGSGYAAALYNDELYLGTNTGLYRSAKNSISDLHQKQYDFIEGSEGQVYSIQELDGKVWVGHHRGAFIVEGEAARPVLPNLGTWKFDYSNEKKNIIAGTYTGFQRFSLSGQSLGPIQDFFESSRLFEFENDSVLWMSHGFKGAFRIVMDPSNEAIKKVGFYGEDKGFPSNILINVFRIGNELIFTGQSGIYLYQPSRDRFEHYSDLEQYLGKDEQVSHLSMDSRGNLYYMKSTDIIGVLKQNRFSGYQKDENLFKRINKYVSDDLINFSIIDHENILIGAKDGFIHYNPSIQKQIIDDFTTHIRSIRVGVRDSIIYAGASNSINRFNLSAKENQLKIDFAAPYFDGFEDVEYQYKLDNFDNEWSEWSQNTSKEYTNLPDRNYTFRVRARNLYGGVSSEATFDFHVDPPWYQSNSAITIYSISFLFIIGFLFYGLDKKHKVDKKEMEISSQKQIMQRDEEIKSVSEKSSETINNLQNEKLQAEIEYKNKELASSTMHLLNKNEVMLSIKSSLEDVSSGSVSNSELKKIIRTIDRNIADDESWEQFTQHFDQVHGDFLKRLKEKYPDITPQETKLAAYLRMNLTTKNIAQLINISVRGVEIGRYRLRKKLNINREVNLTSFLMDF